MWAPSTAICHLVNSGVLMVSRVVGHRAAIRPFLEVFGRDRGADRAGRRLRVWDEYMQRSEVIVRHEARWLLLSSPLSTETHFLFWYTAVTHSAMVVPTADRWSRAFTGVQSHTLFFAEMRNNIICEINHQSHYLTVVTSVGLSSWILSQKQQEWCVLILPFVSFLNGWRIECFYAILYQIYSIVSPPRLIFSDLIFRCGH